METTESFFSDGFDLELLKQPGFFGLGALESVDQGQNVGGIFFRKTYSLAELVKIADRNAAGFLQFEHGEIGTGNSMIQKIGKIGQCKVLLCKKKKGANITMKVVNSYANIKYCMTGKRECQVIQSQSEKMSKFMSKHTKAEKIV